MERINKLKTFLQQNPADDFLQHALALEYIKIGEEHQAKDLFIKILNHNPNYIGSYYHLAKLLERVNENQAAIEFYEKGMAIAKLLKDNHSYNELQAAYEDLIY